MGRIKTMSSVDKLIANPKQPVPNAGCSGTNADLSFVQVASQAASPYLLNQANMRSLLAMTL